MSLETKSPLIDAAHRLPAPCLRPYIARYGAFRIDGVADMTMRTAPSRHITLMIGLGTKFYAGQAGPFTSFVAGLHDRGGLVNTQGTLEGIHVFLNPYGIRALLNFPASALTGRVIQLDDALGAYAHGLNDRLNASTSWQIRFDVLDGLFTRMLKRRAAAPELTWAWQRLTARKAARGITELAREVGWGRRHFTEQFRTEFGITPKTLTRITRFEEACALIRRRDRLVDVATSAGYHDQSHMTREWVALAGCTPKTWIIEELPFVQDYELAALDTLS